MSVVSGPPPGDGELVAVGLMEPLLFDYKEAWNRPAHGAELAIQVEKIWNAFDTARSRTRNWPADW